MKTLTKMIILSIGLVGMLSSSYATPQKNPTALPVKFQHNDWQLVCDNTRTCRAVGYQDEDSQNSNPVALMLSRKAGGNMRVRASVMLGKDPYFLEDAKKIKNCKVASDKPKLTINGKDYGTLPIYDKDDESYQLSVKQTHAIINTLAKSSTIDIVENCYRYRVSDKGSTAVLLKMDEVQGRLGTRGAIIKRGKKSEKLVLPAIPMPVVKAVKINDKAMKRKSDKALFAKLAKKMNNIAIATLKTKDNGEISDYCPILTDTKSAEYDNKYYQSDNWNFYRLNNKQLLAEHICWRGAYNTGIGYWLINDTAPYNTQLITESGSGYDSGEIMLGQKGRGIGDCWDLANWSWNGKTFIQTSEATTGLCRSIRAGGAFNLPTVVTKVIE